MRPLALLHSLYEALKVIIFIALLVQADDGEVETEVGREGKQFGSGRPGSGRSRGGLSRLEQGPLTLKGGKLRPVVERLNKVDRVGGIRPGLQRRPGVLPLIPQKPRPPLPSLRPQQYFPSDNVPFRYNAQPAVPEVHMSGPNSPSEQFHNFEGETSNDQEVAPSKPIQTTLQRPYPNAPLRAEVIDDWSSKVRLVKPIHFTPQVSQSTDGKQTVLLDTKYFSLSYPEEDAAVTSARPPAKPAVSGRPGLVLRKVKGRMKTSTIRTSTTARRVTEETDLCGNDALLECDDTPENLTSVVKKEDAGPASSVATYKELLKHFKKEVWVIPVLIASGIIILILTIYEIFLLAKAVNKNPSRRHLFLGQMLLAGLLACSGMAVVHTLLPTNVTCAVIRLGTGLAYSLVYSTLLVKLVFLISLNSGVYLPATYQSLLLSFAILIQLVIGVQWLVSAPPDVTQLPLAPGSTEETFATCATLFKQQLLGLLYVVFLILVVVLLSFKSRGVRENYREAMYVGLTIGFTVAIWIVWILAGFIVPTRYQDVCSACGLIACTSITFVIMFMPKGRQLSAMGREGVYAEDRTDVYTGSGTGSTGSSGTPSPSFFPVKPGKMGASGGSRHQFREKELKEREFKERLPERDRLDTPPSAHKHLQRHSSSRHDDNIYTSLEALNNTERFPYKSQPSRHNPNVLFRRPNDMPPGFMY